MDKSAARNALVVLGAWSVSSLLGQLIDIALIPLTSGRTYQGDTGTITMWVVLGIHQVFAAAIASTVLLWLVDAEKPWAWIVGLAAMLSYSGALDAWRRLNHGWRIGPRTPDYIGIGADAILPVLACLIVGLWWAGRKTVAQEPSR